MTYDDRPQLTERQKEAAKDARYSAVSDAMRAKVEAACRKAGHKRVRVIYSAYDMDEDDVPIDNLDHPATAWAYGDDADGNRHREDRPLPARFILFRPRDDFFGGEKSRDYVSTPLEGATWLEVCVHANAAIRKTRDLHHVFLEGLEPSDAGPREDGIVVYEMVMGS